MTQVKVTQVKSESGTRRRVNTRANLVEAAIGVFADRGTRRVTVDDLAGAAGYTRGAFYSNFASIEEVLLEAFQQQSRRMLGAVRTVTGLKEDACVDPDRAVRRMLAAVEPFEREWYALHTEVSMLCLRDEEARQVAVGITEQLGDQLTEVVDLVLVALDRSAVVPARTLGEAVLALYLHSLGAGVLEPGAPAHRMLAEVMPTVIAGLSRPR